MTAGITVEHISNDWYEPISAVANEDFTLWLEWLREAHIHLMAECVCVCEWEWDECLWTMLLFQVRVAADKFRFNQ